jgi:hypothetical protein
MPTLNGELDGPSSLTGSGHNNGGEVGHLSPMKGGGVSVGDDTYRR